MRTEKEKKKRFNFVKFIVVSLFLYIIFYLLYLFFNYPIKNIYIYGNNYISDQEVIDSAGIRNYPSFILTTKNSMIKSLSKNMLIKSSKIEKRLLGEVHITIKENKPLFYNNITKKTVLGDGRETDSQFEVPILTNTMSEDIYNKLLNKMNNVNEDIMLKISEIEYSPNEKDDERILLSMTDGNYVYLTLYKFENINYYNKILPTLEGKKGTLYLDSGNYFEY